MRFSIRLNNDLEVATLVQAAQTAERAGFDQIWVSNDLFLRSAPVLLAAMAGATDEIQVGSAILNPYTLHPAEIAMMAATLQEVSHGRFALGIAAGAREFLGWVGIEQKRPLQKMRRTLIELRQWLRGVPAGAVGGDLRISNEAYLRFGGSAAGASDVPIYLGASGPRMQELAGELADGVLPLLFPPERFSAVRERVAVGLGRRAEPAERDFDFVTCFWASVDADPLRARQPLAEKIAYYGPAMGPHLLEPLGLEDGDFAPIRRALAERRPVSEVADLVDERMLRIGACGTPEQLVERLRPLIAEGARHLSFGPPLGPNVVVAIETLGRDVLPALR